MPIEEIRVLLEKYQQGICTAEERKVVEEWYDSLQLENGGLSESSLNSSLDKIRTNLRQLPGMTGTGSPGGEGTLANIDSMVAVPGSHILTETGSSVVAIHPTRWKRDLVVAASAVLITVTLGWSWLHLRRPSAAKPALALRDKGDTTVFTNRGETKQIVLPDGSTIELNAGTEFRYPKVFSGGGREVTLVRGEAFFQITGDAARPFTVTTGHWRTLVLGTAFDIRAYGQESSSQTAGHRESTDQTAGPRESTDQSAGTPPSATPLDNAAEPYTQIALVTGKVLVSATTGNQSTLLSPHQLVRIDRLSGKMQTDRFTNDYEVAAWKEGAMHFKDATFADIAFGIGIKYNVSLLNKSSKQRWSYNGLFRNESLQEVVETLCQTEGLGYRFSGEGIVITNRN